MKVYYKKCFRCKELKPLISYYLSKEENLNLTDKEKKLCYDCYKKNKMVIFSKKKEEGNEKNLWRRFFSKSIKRIFL